MYAIVRSGGRQLKASVGEVLELDRRNDAVGTTVELTPLLLVDGDSITAETSALSGARVAVEVLGETKGPKITILHYKNKTGYRKRQGHRQHYTQVRVTGIES